MRRKILKTDTGYKGRVMKLIHLSDLHVGKHVNGFSMLEDQSCILEKINEIIDEENPRGVLIAGDVYDRSVPPGEALAMVDDFLVGLSQKGIPVFVISGNHDSPERLAFGGRIMANSGVYFSPVYNGPEEPVILEDEFGEVAIYMLPFIKPVHVRRAFPEEEIDGWEQAAALAVSRMQVDPSRRNVLLAHQFVTGAERSESEEVTVGGVDNISAGIFNVFDYVALGHLHKAQTVRGISEPTSSIQDPWPQEAAGILRYCGAPLAYSFSEGEDEKSLTVLEMGAKEDRKNWQIREVPLEPQRRMRTIEGKFAELTNRAFYEQENLNDYIRVILNDEDDVPGAMDVLHGIYKNMMKLEYRNSRTESQGAEAGERMNEIHPLEVMEQFFEQQNGRAMTEEQRAVVKQLVDEIWGEDE